MADIEKQYAYDLQRRNTLRNYVLTIGNLGIGAGGAGSGGEDDPEMGSTTITFVDGSQESFDWKGALTFDTMVQAGIVEG